ncbi:hypothetical protein BKA83DRAFT_4128021 [Pisolithus microcarpus]|nr:hypothetical protein BKA83DRAFT_4129801 [Pisolithus microcarpus]KAI6015719.1 hypothetical protein BKA83DRAFT_4129185 [Pisolithus microcarpus]KAI6018110.1 hypothetical protein BKA83DRAFT_4128021 [Pisolithus microcarpus]
MSMENPHPPIRGMEKSHSGSWAISTPMENLQLPNWRIPIPPKKGWRIPIWQWGNLATHGESPTAQLENPHPPIRGMEKSHSGSWRFLISQSLPFRWFVPWRNLTPHLGNGLFTLENPQNSPWKWSIYPGESPKLTLAVVYFILGNPPTHYCGRSIWPRESPNIAQFRPLYMLEKVPLGPQTPPTLMVTIGYPWENGLSPLWHVSFWRISKPVCPSGMWEYPRS